MDQVDDDGQQKWLYSNDTKHGKAKAKKTKASKKSIKISL